MIETGHYHLTGVAGIGMSALAQILLAEGCTVSGSDRDYDFGKDMEIIRKLRGVGVQFVPQDGSGITEKTRGVMISTAIENDNLDILAANRLNVPVIHRAEMLADLVADKRCVAVTGTSGKSTVTGMIGWVLEQLGTDPVVVNGGIVLNWRNEETIGNVRCGSSNLWIIEADESDRSLLNFHPDWAVITSVSKDHFEMSDAVELFRTFSRQVRTGLVSVLDEPDFLQDLDLELSAEGSDFEYRGVPFHVSLPGRHNAENALCAIVLCQRLGFHLEQISEALASFKGIERRLETVGTAHGITVVDDYAHNPAKIWAAWQAVAPYYKRMLAVWRPHGYRPLAMMMDELISTFSEICRQSDRIYILPVYDAGGTADRSVNSGMLAENLRRQNVPAVAVDSADELVRRIAETAEPGDVVLMMGARDPELSVLARKIFGAVSRSRAG